MSLLRAARELWRELREVQALLGLPRGERRLVVYSEDAASYNMFEGYLTRLREEYARGVVYITSDSADPLLSRRAPDFSPFRVSRLVPTLLPRIDSEIFVTTMPDLGKLHVARPKPETCCVYVFHSLNSIHEVYRKGAFDHYDAFFCAGPHHVRELETHFAESGGKQPELYKVGYYKLDRVAEKHQAWGEARAPGTTTTILLAPSWGKRNFLETHGVEIVEALIDLGARVIVRPHPCFFLPIYPGGAEVVERIARRFPNDPRVAIERSIRSEDSFFEADLMVSDFSGAAYEYALGTLRPVLFIDVPRKTLNPDWRDLGLPTFEDTMRHECGRVVAVDEIPRIAEHASRLLSDPAGFRERLRGVRSRAIYNFGRSAEVGAAVLENQLRKSEGRAPVQTIRESERVCLPSM